MPLPFDATLKDLAREHPRALLAAFDTPSAEPLRLLNVVLSTVTTAADVVIGLGNPLRDIVHFDFQASAAASKHVDVLVTTPSCTANTRYRSIPSWCCFDRRRPIPAWTARWHTQRGPAAVE